MNNSIGTRVGGTSSIKVIKLECTIAKRRNIYEKYSKAEATGWITPQWLWRGERRGEGGVVSCFRRSPIRGHRCRLEMYMHFNTLKFASRDIYMYMNIVWLPRTNRVFHPNIFHSQISLSSLRLYSSPLRARPCISRIFLYLYVCRTCAIVKLYLFFDDAFALRSLIPIKGIEIISW